VDSYHIALTTLSLKLTELAISNALIAIVESVRLFSLVPQSPRSTELPGNKELRGVFTLAHSIPAGIFHF